MMRLARLTRGSSPLFRVAAVARQSPATAAATSCFSSFSSSSSSSSPSSFCSSSASPSRGPSPAWSSTFEGRRHLCTASPPPTPAGSGKGGAGDDGDADGAPASTAPDVLIYEGAFNGILKRIKRVSVVSCSMTMVGVPYLALYWNPDIALMGRAAVAFVTISFGVLTTAGVWGLSKPYVTRILAGEKGAVTLETLSLLAMPVSNTILLRDVQPPRPRPLESFYAGGGGYYVHEAGWLPAEDVGYDEGLLPSAEEGGEGGEGEGGAVGATTTAADEKAVEGALRTAQLLKGAVDRFAPPPKEDEQQ